MKGTVITVRYTRSVRLTRVLKYLNYLIGLALIALLGTVWWFAWRPLPDSSGEIRAAITQPGSITRDSLGVPHIKAATVEDALYLQGYATAQDRLWQMDSIRRYASGELSEIIGPSTLELDRESRKLRMRRLAEEHTRALPPEDRRYAAAYARGVNAFIESHRDRLPVEFTLLQYQPRPWTIADSVVIGLQMYRDLTNSWKTDILRGAMLSTPNADLAKELFPVRTGIEVQPGSNAFVVSGKFTASGKPMLANDTHLEWGAPSTWHMVSLEAPNLNVTGFALPGLPAVIIGHNDRIAWGVTNLQFDVQDLYLEQINVQNGLYLFNGQPAQARPEREAIQVRGSRPVEFNNWVTRHGPIWNASANQVLTLRWAAAEPGRFQMSIIQLNQARNWEEFRTALRRFSGPGQNFVYIDVDGNIGYQATGILPVRRGFDGRQPLNGVAGQQEWDGFVPFEDLPTAFNPPSGRIVTANQNPFPENWKYDVSGDFDPGYRSRQIDALLGARASGWKPEDMVVVQKDVYSEFLLRVAKAVVQAADRKKPRDEMARDAVEQLRGWNGQAEKGLAAPMIATLVYQQIRTDLAARAGAKDVEYAYSTAASVVDRLLRERPKIWFPDWDAELMSALGKSIEEGRRQQGRNVSKWDQGLYLALELKHPVISKVPWIGSWFNIGPELMSGAGTTVKQTSRRLGPSMRMVADAGNWNSSLASITIGESGQILSKHFKDQWSTYWAGRAFPMPFGAEAKGDILRVVPE